MWEQEEVKVTEMAEHINKRERKGWALHSWHPVQSNQTYDVPGDRRGLIVTHVMCLFSKAP